jgi:hypothetical protein
VQVRVRSSGCNVFAGWGWFDCRRLDRQTAIFVEFDNELFLTTHGLQAMVKDAGTDSLDWGHESCHVHVTVDCSHGADIQQHPAQDFEIHRGIGR